MNRNVYVCKLFRGELLFFGHFLLEELVAPFSVWHFPVVVTQLIAALCDYGMFGEKYCMKYVADMATPREDQDQPWRRILTAALAELEDSELSPWY